MVLPSLLQTGIKSCASWKVNWLALPPEEGTEYKSPLKVKTILLPSGEMEGYRSQFGVSYADTSEKTKSIKMLAKTLKLFMIFKGDNDNGK